MNRRQVINKILHDHIDVDSYEDYTDYKKLITAIEEWHEGEVRKLTTPHIMKKENKGQIIQTFMWISVKDALPPHRVNVLVYGEEDYLDEHDQKIFIMYYSDEGKYWRCPQEGWQYNVTHWCYLPQPPNE